MKACLCANAHFTKGVLACFLELMAKFLAILLFFSSIDITNTYLSEISAAKVQKIIQKTAFGEDINTIPTLKCAFCQEKRYIEDGNSPRKQLNSIKPKIRSTLV
jgi:hypothetical protein